MLSFHSIRGMRVSLASPDTIRSWSFGEVLRAETLNYRTLKPERDGLFCERIFGPIKSFTCACGKYKRERRKKGIRCDQCGVLIAPASIRRAHMGHIELATPIAHPWFVQGTPARLGLLLNLARRDLNDILYYNRYIVMKVHEETRTQAIQRVKAEIARLQSLSQTMDQSAPPSPSQVTHAPIHTPYPSALQEINSLSEETQTTSSPNADVPWDHQRIQQLRTTLHLLTSLHEGSTLSVEQHRILSREASNVFQTGIGAEAIQALLARLDLDAISQELRREIMEKEDARRAHAIKRLKLVEALRTSNVKPEWMIMTVLPVLPPDLRPVLRMAGGRFAAADINELYCRVIHRNNRLKQLLEVGAPDLAINRERQSLQLACDALFDNGHSRQPIIGPHKRPLRSLSDTLSGKRGRFRHNLLGKRVDYSGRSVINVGLDLKIHQCGLPKKIALELFKPFLIQKLLAYGIVETHRQAKHTVEHPDSEVWDMLAEVMHGKVVLLNRAPTLHRLSIQAFEPVLVEGHAIRVHPQVCSAFNADFDGDQMAVHLPLSPEAQAEAREHMLSTHNLFSPATGEPSIAVAQEQVLGCYYLTQERPQKKGEGHIFADEQDAILAYTHGLVDLQAPIYVRMTIETIYEQPPPAAPTILSRGMRLRTTVGRLLFNRALPKVLRFRNYAMKKDCLRQLVWDCIKVCGQERAAIMADAIKRLGFQYATRAAISFSMKDIVVPPQKKAILAQSDASASALRDEWQQGTMTREELYQRTVDLWQAATDKVAELAQNVLDPYGSIATIASSGATKAKLQQIRQLSGMRGLMASPSGAIIETPVRGNFLEGLTVAEYFLSSHGARKSMMDRSLNTAQSGYLTSQLINVAQEIVVTEEDCGTQEGLIISDKESAYLGLPDSTNRLLGRILSKDVPEADLAQGDELDESTIARLLKAGVTEVEVRSVLTCQARSGVCGKCYGWDLSKRALVQKGVAVGIIAAQSIGEPGTQLTMRTFHSGGIAGDQGDITLGIPRIKELFDARIPRDPAVVSEIAGVVTVIKDERTKGHIIRVVSDHCTPINQSEVRRVYTIPAERRVLVCTGQHVRAGDPLTNGARNLQEILQYQGRFALARYLLQEAQLVYRTTGAYIHDKHFEIIIRQMLRYVCIETSGDTTFLPEDIIDRFVYSDTNTRIQAKGGKPATARPMILGLIPATLATESWLAAASFQQTTRVLTDAILEGRTDILRGIKENVILGKMIPAGTGILPRPVRPIRRKRGRPPKTQLLPSF